MSWPTPLLLFALAAPLQAQLPRYDVIELPLPENLFAEGGFAPVEFDPDDADAPRPTWSTAGIAINDGRVVIGEVRMQMSGFGTETVRPVRWTRRGGSFRGELLPQLPRGRTRLVDLNDDGVIIGYAIGSQRKIIPFILDGNKVTRPLENREFASWTPTAINDDGLIVGYHTADARGRGPADLVLYHYRKNKTDTSCVIEGGGRAYDVNEHGWVAGQDARGQALLFGPVTSQGDLRRCDALERLEAAAWEGSAPRVLRLLADDYRAIGASAADARQAQAWTSAILEPAEAKVRPGEAQTIGFRVSDWNAAGLVVGSDGGVTDSGAGNTVQGRAMVWQDGRSAGLGTRIAKQSPWTLETAASVNGRGWITGRGQRRLEGSTKSVTRGFVLKPL